MKNGSIAAYSVIALVIGGLILNNIHLEKTTLKNERLIQQNYDDINTLKWQKAELITEIDFLGSALRTFDYTYATIYVEPDDPEIRNLAVSLGSPEEIYDFVRDNITYDWTNEHYSAATVLKAGKGDCTGKANLLCSLLEAMGIPKNEVHVVFGAIIHGGMPCRHAWVELYYNNRWLVLDCSAYPGDFSFDQWERDAFYRHFSAKNWIEYNDGYSTIIRKVDLFEP